MRIHIVPTYECNLECEYCYSKNNKTLYPTDLQFNRYKSIIDSLILKGLTSVSFIGGEPTLWKDLQMAMEYARSQKLKVVLYTNGSYTPVIPDLVIINATRWKDSQISEKIMMNLRRYSDYGTQIVYRCNIDLRDEKSSFASLFTTGFLLKAQLSVAVLDVMPYDTRLGEYVYGFCKDALDFFDVVDLSRPIPLCMFTDEQREFLSGNCGLHGSCNNNSLIPVINPDGETMYPCNSYHENFAFEDYMNGKIGAEDFKKAVEVFHEKSLPEACLECQHKASGSCFCGCFVDRAAGTVISCNK